MKLHIIGGFLGSGKTTAITKASKVMMHDGKKVAVVTNDQGKYLVDTSFVESNEIPAAEVANGCFCCNFNNLSDQIESLIKSAEPDYIFAESVGSCTDLVATVLKPLQILRRELFDELTFSVFVDSRLLLDHLLEKRLPFSDAIIYIFEKQLEEADLLVINKIDLLQVEDHKILKQLIDSRFDRKIIIFQNSLDLEDVRFWLTRLETLSTHRRVSLDIDYQIYGKGESEMAWLDEEITIHSADFSAWEKAIHFVDVMITEIRQKEIPVGHLKYLLKGEEFSHKISFTTIFDPAWKNNLKGYNVDTVQIMVNSRIETTPEIARTIVRKAISAITFPGIMVSECHEQAFQPGFPNPTHRITRKLPCCDECRCIKNLENAQIEACLCESNMDNGCCCF